MNRALLDTNILIALLDSAHDRFDDATEWLDANFVGGWASCAITQNGFVRIVSQPRYPRSTSTRDATQRLAEACGSGAHEFWPCDVAVVDDRRFDQTLILGPSQITDLYLLALAVQHGGRLVTFDRTIPLGPVVGATKDHLVVL